jgi:hypothetical protein
VPSPWLVDENVLRMQAVLIEYLFTFQFVFLVLKAQVCNIVWIVFFAFTEPV